MTCIYMHYMTYKIRLCAAYSGYGSHGPDRVSSFPMPCENSCQRSWFSKASRKSKWHVFYRVCWGARFGNHVHVSPSYPEQGAAYSLRNVAALAKVWVISDRATILHGMFAGYLVQRQHIAVKFYAWRLSNLYTSACPLGYFQVFQTVVRYQMRQAT